MIDSIYNRIDNAFSHFDEAKIRYDIFPFFTFDISCPLVNRTVKICMENDIFDNDYHTFYHGYHIPIPIGDNQFRSFKDWNQLHTILKQAIIRTRCEDNLITIKYTSSYVIIRLLYKVNNFRNLDFIFKKCKLFNKLSNSNPFCHITPEYSENKGITLYLKSDKSYNKLIDDDIEKSIYQLKEIFGEDCIEKVYDNIEEVYESNNYLKNIKSSIIAEIKNDLIL